MTKPITPEQLKHEIPDGVIEIFNELIQKYWNGRSATFLQDEVIELLHQRMIRDVSIAKSIEIIFSKHYLDVETIYESAGWQVDYSKPAYNEIFAATFTFTKR